CGLHPFSKRFRGVPWVGAAEDRPEVADDLDWRQDQTEGETPPPQQHAEQHSPNLVFDSARLAAELFLCPPRGKEESRPDLVTRMDLDRPCPAALGASSLMDGADLLRDRVLLARAGRLKLPAAATRFLATVQEAQCRAVVVDLPIAVIVARHRSP